MIAVSESVTSQLTSGMQQSERQRTTRNAVRVELHCYMLELTQHK